MHAFMRIKSVKSANKLINYVYKVIHNILIYTLKIIMLYKMLVIFNNYNIKFILLIK